MKIVTLSMLFALSFHAAGQAGAPDSQLKPSTDNHAPPSESLSKGGAAGTIVADAEVPILRLQFSVHDPLTGVHGTSAFLAPPQCSQGGIPFVPFITPKDFGMQSVQSLDPEGGHEFSVRAAHSLFGIDFVRSYLVSDSAVDLLVNGTKDSTRGPEVMSMGPELPPRPIYTGERHDFLLKFDLNGTYQSAVELPDRYQFRRIAPLPGDSILAIAFDRPNSTPKLLLLDSDGQNPRELQLPDDLRNRPETTAALTGGMTEQMNAEGSLNGWHLASVRHKVLLYLPHASDSVFEVGAGGVLRQVRVQSPKGFKLDTVIPSTDRWLIVFRKENLSDSAEINTDPRAGNFVLYEIDSEDGSEKRQLIDDAGPLDSIACEANGSLTAFTVDEGKVKLETAEVGR